MDYTKQTVLSLKQMCKERKIVGYSKKVKTELIAFLREYEEKERKIRINYLMDMLTKKTEDTKKATTKQEKSVKECCICYNNIAVNELLAFVPCGHRCVCSECVKKIVSGNITKRKCQLCRKRVKEAMVVYD